MYKLTNGNWVIKLDVTSETWIPKDEANPKYHEHLAWLAEGNTPEPADPEPITPYTVLREAAYKLEADPLFFQDQRGEVPAGTWADKVAEIKLRIPKT